MRKRLCALGLALILASSLSPVLAAEPAEDIAARFPAVHTYEGFSDVDEDAWYAPYVKLCYETGLMSGTGDGQFSPGGTVSCAESATLAARIHQILNGGDGLLPAAPEDWGTITLTTGDGTELTGGGESFSWGGWRHDDFGYLYYNLSDDQAEWGKSQSGQPAMIEAEGTAYTGTLDCSLPLGNWILAFHPDEGDASEAGRALRDILSRGRPGPDQWYRDTACYLESAGLSGAPGFSYSEADAPRLWFVQSMSAVTGELLTPGGAITDFPDAGQYGEWTAYILAFYNLGLLTGVDGQGTFDGEKSLTRAEAAAVLARLVRPELRIGPDDPSVPPRR